MKTTVASYCLCVVLIAANVVVHSSAYAMPSDLISKIRSEGCKAEAEPRGETSSYAEVKQALESTSVNCNNCYQASQTNQHWCRDLTGGCNDFFPWHTNFEWERTVRFFNCPNNVTAIRCGVWIDSGCCGSDDDEQPVCGENGERPCSENSLPPEF